MENRNGLVVNSTITHATGTAEREAAAKMIADAAGEKRITVGGGRGYDRKEFVGSLQALKTTPHVAQKSNRNCGSAIYGRTTQHEGYQVSFRMRKRIEEAFGWIKTVGNLRKTQHAALKRSIGTLPSRCQPATSYGCEEPGVTA